MIVAHFLYISSSLVAGGFYCAPFVLYTFIVRLCPSLKRNIKKETSGPRQFPLSCPNGSTMRFIASRWYFYWRLTESEEVPLLNLFFSQQKKTRTILCVYVRKTALVMHMIWTRGWIRSRVEPFKTVTMCEYENMWVRKTRSARGNGLHSIASLSDSPETIAAERLIYIETVCFSFGCKLPRHVQDGD